MKRRILIVLSIILSVVFIPFVVGKLINYFRYYQESETFLIWIMGLCALALLYMALYICAVLIVEVIDYIQNG